MGNFITGSYLKRICEYERSIRFIQKAKMSGPPDMRYIDTVISEVRLSLAIEHYFLGHYDDALKTLLSSGSDVSQLPSKELLLYGMCLWHQKRYDKVRVVSDIARKRYPSNLYFRLFDFRLKLINQDIDECVEMLHSGYIDLKANPDIAITIGDLIWNQRFYKEAAEVYTDNLRYNPDNTALLYRLAVYNFRVRNETEKARYYLEKLLSLDFQYPGAQKEYSLLLLLGTWPADKPFGYYREQINLTMPQSEWAYLLSIMVGNRRAISDEYLP